jgi:hypothetical protein
MAGMASLLILLILLATAIAAQPQTFRVLHTFTGGDGVGPDAGLTMDRSGRLYGTVNGGTGNFGSVFRMAESGSGWVLNPLHQFVPPLANGDGPDVKAIFGPDGNLYSATAIGGDEQADCENDGQGCGVVFKLQPPATACVSFLCPWTETVLYQFTGQPDGDSPGSEVIFDAAGKSLRHDRLRWHGKLRQRLRDGLRALALRGRMDRKGYLQFSGSERRVLTIWRPHLRCHRQSLWSGPGR